MQNQYVALFHKDLAVITSLVVITGKCVLMQQHDGSVCLMQQSNGKAVVMASDFVDKGPIIQWGPDNDMGWGPGQSMGW